MKHKVIATAATAIVAFGSLSVTSFAQQSKTGGDEQKTLPPAIPLAKPNPDTKKSNVPQTATRRRPPIDPEAAARFQRAVQPSDDSLRRTQMLYRAGDLAGAEQAAQETITLAANLSPTAVIISRRINGQIRMQQGRYKEALEWLQPYRQEGMDARLDLDIALCYVRLGNYRMARQLYSDQSILDYNSAVTIQDLPGTRTPQTLEASILLACGSDSLIRGREEEAFANLSAALKLAPKNGLAAYFAARSLGDMGRYTEAGPYFVQAAENGRGKIAAKAKGFAATYLRNQERLKSQQQTAVKSQP